MINLQLEYLTQRLRALIYQDETYIRVASDIAAKKRMKITQLGIKFNLTTIFNGEDVEQFVDKYFGILMDCRIFSIKMHNRRGYKEIMMRGICFTEER